MIPARRRVPTNHRAAPKTTCALTGRPAESRDAVVRLYGLGFEALVLADPFFEKFVNPHIRAHATPGQTTTTRNQRALKIPGLKPITGRARTSCYEFNLRVFLNAASVPLVSEFYKKLAKGTALGEMFESSAGLERLLSADARAPRKNTSAA